MEAGDRFCSNCGQPAQAVTSAFSLVNGGRKPENDLFEGLRQELS